MAPIMRNVKHLTESQLRKVIRARVLTELKKIEQNSPMKMIDYAYSPENRCIEFESPQEALDFINKNWDVGDVMSISHALFFGQCTVYAWKMTVDEYLDGILQGANPRSFAPYKKKGFMKITDDDTLLKFLQFIEDKYGELVLYQY